MRTYTAAQAEAIACLGEPLQIIACAGSGKTQVISQRIASILAVPGVKPQNVIAFTFTEKAAAELKERVLSIMEKEGLGTRGLAEMYIGTMHGYALDLLQRLVPETFKFSVLTEITSRMLVDRNSRKSGLTVCPTSSSGTPYLRRFLHSRLFLQATSVLREDAVDWDLVPAGLVSSFEDYMKLLYGHAYFDFTEMIHLAVQFLEGDPDDDESAGIVQQHIRDDIRYVVVDEYQDVNPLQERLVRGLSQFGANLCVVGDDDQTIYQWRGSEVSNILTFKDRYVGVRQVTLAENFRSSQGVVEVGRSVAERIPGANRLPKVMVRAGHQNWQRGDMIAREFADEHEEATWICDRVEAMRGLAFSDTAEGNPRGLSWSDFAILYRSVANDAGPLVQEMRRRDIPYVVKGLNRLFDSPEIQAVVGVFRYMAGLIAEADLRSLWDGASLLPADAAWAEALAVLDDGRDWDRGERWGVYNIQRLYLEFLEAAGLREQTVPGEPVRRELVFYQLGKFSQAISDFEQIYFTTEPRKKYEAFGAWLEYQAPGYYAESDADVGYAAPDAVVLTTVHQAKGMQSPALFLPCLRANRFPAKRQGGLGLFHVIPEAAISDADRYKGALDDETRLFYVAVTRAQKYLFASFSPGSSQLYRRRSAFFDHCAAQQWFSTRDPGVPADARRLEPHARQEIPDVTLSFSELKYLLECPYQFKLRFLYGFNPPLHEALGYGKGLHDALAEVHKRAINGDLASSEEAEDLVTRHLHTAYAYPDLKATLQRAAVQSVQRYLKEHETDLERTVHGEKQIQVHVVPGITVDGRIDLLRRLDTDELAIVDFKSTARPQDEDVTRDQLHVYAVGYEELTGQRADLIEVLNLDEEGKTIREEVEDPLLAAVRSRIKDAGDSLRENNLPRLPVWSEQCGKCDLAELCRDVPASAKSERRAATGR
jgi:DNA helicase-2/ATP-dependent DNA helicase PcrA